MLPNAAKMRAADGENRDPIYAPDGRTWYDMLLAEAERRGKYQDALCQIARQKLSVEMDEEERELADWEGGYEAIVGIARDAIA